MGSFHAITHRYPQQLYETSRQNKNNNWQRVLKGNNKKSNESNDGPQREEKSPFFSVPFSITRSANAANGPGGGDQIQGSTDTCKSYCIYMVQYVLLLILNQPTTSTTCFVSINHPPFKLITQDDSRKAARNRKRDPLWIVSCLIDSYSSVLYVLACRLINKMRAKKRTHSTPSKQSSTACTFNHQSARFCCALPPWNWRPSAAVCPHRHISCFFFFPTNVIHPFATIRIRRRGRKKGWCDGRDALPLVQKTSLVPIYPPKLHTCQLVHCAVINLRNSLALRNGPVYPDPCPYTSTS